MDMFNQESGISLNQNERERLFLIWLAHNNFDILKKDTNLLKSGWQKIKQEAQPYFKGFHRSIDEICNDFQEITITNDPTMSFYFDTDPLALKFNIVGLFFSSYPHPKKGNFVATLPWKLGGQLVHEHDHLLWFKEHNLILKTKKEGDEYYVKHLVEIEKRAFQNQIAFLENAKKHLPISDVINSIRIDCWSASGEPFLSKHSFSDVLSQVEAAAYIDQSKTTFTKIISELDNNYSREGNSNNMRLVRKMLRILAIDEPVKEANDFPSVKIPM